MAELSGTDNLQQRLQNVLVLLDGLSRAAFEPFPQPVLCCLAYGVGGVASFRGDPMSTSACRAFSLSLTAVLVLPATFLRMRRWIPRLPLLVRDEAVVDAFHEVGFAVGAIPNPHWRP